MQFEIATCIHFVKYTITYTIKYLFVYVSVKNVKDDKFLKYCTFILLKIKYYKIYILRNVVPSLTKRKSLESLPNR